MIGSRFSYALVYVAGLASTIVVEEILRFTFRRASHRAANTLLGRAVLRRTKSKRNSIMEKLSYPLGNGSRGNQYTVGCYRRGAV